MGSMAISTDAASIAGAAAQSPVLRVIVENLFYPVTLDVLHQVHQYFQFHMCSVSKIIKWKTVIRCGDP